MKEYEFVEREEATHRVRVLCGIVGASPSRYYTRCTRGMLARAHADARLSIQVVLIHHASRATYGAPQR